MHIHSSEKKLVRNWKKSYLLSLLFRLLFPLYLSSENNRHFLMALRAAVLEAHRFLSHPHDNKECLSRERHKTRYQARNCRMPGRSVLLWRQGCDVTVEVLLLGTKFWCLDWKWNEIKSNGGNFVGPGQFEESFGRLTITGGHEREMCGEKRVLWRGRWRNYQNTY